MYRSKLFNIVLNHRFTNLDCADQYVVQMCPELTKFLPKCNYVKFLICLFSNVLHSSGPNTSLDKRWNLVLAYNQVQPFSARARFIHEVFQVQNAPLTSGFLPPPQPLILVEDEDVLAKARSRLSFFSPIFFINIFSPINSRPPTKSSSPSFSIHS